MVLCDTTRSLKPRVVRRCHGMCSKYAMIHNAFICNRCTKFDLSLSLGRLCNKLDLMRVLVVGAGITGACLVSLLQKATVPLASLTVWDKARGSGGLRTIYLNNKSKKLTPIFTRSHEHLEVQRGRTGTR